MPRDATMEVAYAQLTANPAVLANVANVAIAGLGNVGYEVANANDPHLAIGFVPQITGVTAAALVSLAISDVTNSTQQQLNVAQSNSTADVATSRGAMIVFARFIPANLTNLPTLQGPRVLALQMWASAGAGQPVAAATSPIFLQILNLARQ